MFGRVGAYLRERRVERAEVQKDRARALKRGNEGLSKETARRVLKGALKQRQKRPATSTDREFFEREREGEALKMRMSIKLALDSQGIINTRKDPSRRKRILTLLDERDAREDAINRIMPQTESQAEFNRAFYKKRLNDVMHQRIERSLEAEFGGARKFKKFEDSVMKHLKKVESEMDTASHDWFNNRYQ